MPTQAIIPVTPGSGLDLDAVSLVIGPNTVFREVLVIADPSNATYLATVNSDGTLNVALPSAQAPPSAAAIGTAVATDLLIGTQAAGSSVPVALPTATITALTPPTAAAIAAAIVANPPTVGISGTVAATQSETWTVGISAAQTIAVTNAGTFAVQATLSAETTKVIGTVNQGTSPWIVASNLTHNNAAPSTANLGVLSAVANAAAPTFTEGKQVLLSTDLAGNLRTSGTFTGTITGAVTGTLTNNNAAPSTNNIGALTILANAADPTWTEGDLVTASANLAGYQRVLLHAETTKVIGVVRTSDGAGNLLTSNSTTPAGHFALDSNITSILGTAPTTAGFLDIKGADGNVFVQQTTGTNLHVVTDSTSTTAVTQATASSLNATIVGTLTNNNAAPAATNVGALTAIANAAAPSFTEGDQVLVSVDLSGHQRVVATGAAANGASAAGNPVLIAGWDNSSNARTLALNNSGIICLGSNGSGSDGASNSGIAFPNDDNRNQSYTPIFSWIFNGTTWDRARSAGVTGMQGQTPVPTTSATAALTPKPIASTAQALLKASAGNLYGMFLQNLAEVTTTTTVEVMYIHFFNTTTTTGLSTTSWLFNLPLPASTTGSLGNTGQANPLSLPPGAHALANFSSGIVIVINTTSASNTTASGTAPVGVVWVQ